MILLGAIIERVTGMSYSTTSAPACSAGRDDGNRVAAGERDGPEPVDGIHAHQ